MNKTFLLWIFLISLSLGAQEFSFDDDFAEDDSFMDDSSGDQDYSGNNALDIGGSLSIPLSLTPLENASLDSSWQGKALLTLNLDWLGEKADFHGSLEALWNGDQPQFSMAEAYMRLYMGPHDMEAGLRKITWGKGDGVHVMDNLNGMDYSAFIEPDYNERKQADLMVRFNFSLGDQGRLELVALPWFTPDIHPVEGQWVQRQALELREYTESFLTNYGNSYYNATYQDLFNLYTAYGMDVAEVPGVAALATAQGIAELESELMREEDTNNLFHSQAGLRFTHNLGSLDWGVSVIRTFMREPLITVVAMDPSSLISPLSADPHIRVEYTPVVLFAEEAGFVLGGFNFRQEAAFYLSEDLQGDKAAFRNPRVDWLFGFDRYLPLSNLSINIQGMGQYVLFSENIAMGDPEYSDSYDDHRLMVALKDQWFHQTLDITLAGSINIEDGDFLIRPQLDYHFKDSAVLGLGYRWYEGDRDSLFGQFDHLDRLILSFEMNF